MARLNEVAYARNIKNVDTTLKKGLIDCVQDLELRRAVAIIGVCMGVMIRHGEMTEMEGNDAVCTVMKACIRASWDTQSDVSKDTLKQ
jgi:hypothetical protein